MKIISVDIGYHNMALIEAVVDNEYEVTVTDVHLVDLKNLPHKRISVQECCLHHTNELGDLLAHFIQEYDSVFKSADRILVERQPPTGLTQIETLIFYLYRDKTILVSPNAMHSHFKISHLDYEERKKQTINIAHDYLNKFPHLGRKHDASDALCLLLFHLWPDKEKIRLRNIDRTLPFHAYRYVSNI